MKQTTSNARRFAFIRLSGTWSHEMVQITAAASYRRVWDAKISGACAVGTQVSHLLRLLYAVWMWNIFRSLSHSGVRNFSVEFHLSKQDLSVDLVISSDLYWTSNIQNLSITVSVCACYFLLVEHCSVNVAATFHSVLSKMCFYKSRVNKPSSGWSECICSCSRVLLIMSSIKTDNPLPFNPNPNP